MDPKLEEQANAALAKWAPLATTADEAHSNVPLHVVLGEAVGRGLSRRGCFDVATMLTHLLG
jgi:hypothetical protein